MAGMDLLLYMMFSVLETCAMFYMMFKVFKIDLYVGRMIFAGLIMAFFSYMIRTVYQLPDLDVFIQILLFFCFTWMLFRIHIFYATIIASCTYQAYFLIQTFYYYIMDQLHAFSSEIPYILSMMTFLLQTLSAATAFSIGYYISYKRKGFDFIPDKSFGKIPLKQKDVILFILSAPSILILTTTLYLTAHFQRWYILIVIIYAVFSLGYVYLSYKRDRLDDESYSL